MTDTLRTLAELKALIPNNITKKVSPQDIRDMLVSLAMQHSQLSEVGNAAPTVLSDTSTFIEIVLTTPVASAISNIQGSADFDQPANGRLRYLGTPTRMFHVACTISFRAASNQREIHFRLGKNGTSSDQTQVERFLSTGADVGSTALHWVVEMETDDYISIMVLNVTSADNVTVSSFNLEAVGMIQ